MLVLVVADDDDGVERHVRDAVTQDRQRLSTALDLGGDHPGAEFVGDLGRGEGETLRVRTNHALAVDEFGHGDIPLGPRDPTLAVENDHGAV